MVGRPRPGFLVQFGVAADPLVTAKWGDQRFADEPNQARLGLGGRVLQYCSHAMLCLFVDL
jgi:hypothetical protein